MKIENYKRLVAQVKGKRDFLTQEIKDAKRNVKGLKKRQEDLEAAQAFLQIVAKETQEQFKFQITDIVQLALDTCFPDEYKFEINFNIKYGKTEAELVFKSDGNDVDPLTASGGGVVDMASFALRIAAWSLGKTDNVMILDEPFKFMSRDLQPRAAKILRELSHRLDLQMIMSTHIKEMIDASDRVFEVEKIKKVSRVTTRENGS